MPAIPAPAPAEASSTAPPAHHSRRQALLFAAALVAALTTWTTVVSPLLPGPPQAAYAWNAAAAVVVLLLAKRWGLSWSELGLSPRRVRAGLRWAALAAAVVAVGYLLLLVVPGGPTLLTGVSPRGLLPGEVALGALVQIPVGTVLWEEMAFRGALLAALLRVLRPPAAVAVSSVLFGLWHVRPAWESATATGGAGDVPVWAVIAMVVAATAAAGWLFGWLRVHTASLLAPAGLHVATNSLGLVATWAAAALL